MNKTPYIERKSVEIIKRLDKVRGEGKIISLVPTMGALHKGHLSLIKAANKQSDFTIVSIFVNPRQFDNGNDFTKYPRQFDRDYDILKNVGIDAIFLPDTSSIYNENFSTNISISGLTDILCGASRVGHFDGVATIITILFNIIRPDITFFGEKDYQQLQIIHRLHADIFLSGKIVSVATIRENNGLAMSSRNARLTAKNLEIAPLLYQNMQFVKENLHKYLLATLLEMAKDNLKLAGFEIDYFEVRYSDNLDDVGDISFEEIMNSNLHLFAAVNLGDVRLIDNIEL